jgi:hypothetical protein
LQPRAGSAAEWCRESQLTSGRRAPFLHRTLARPDIRSAEMTDKSLTCGGSPWFADRPAFSAKIRSRSPVRSRTDPLSSSSLWRRPSRRAVRRSRSRCLAAWSRICAARGRRAWGSTYAYVARSPPTGASGPAPLGAARPTLTDRVTRDGFGPVARLSGFRRSVVRHCPPGGIEPSRKVRIVHPRRRTNSKPRSRSATPEVKPTILAVLGLAVKRQMIAKRTAPMAHPVALNLPAPPGRA